MQEKVRERKYRMTTHAEEKMADDGLTLYDVEQGILTDKILERQKDVETGEWKYCIRGETVTAGQVEAAQRALADDASGCLAQLLRDLGRTLEPGAALGAVLVEHVWATEVAPDLLA